MRQFATDDRLVKQAMGTLLGHLKAASRSAEDLAAAIGAQYPTASGWKARIGQIIDEAASVAA